MTPQPRQQTAEVKTPVNTSAFVVVKALPVNGKCAVAAAGSRRPAPLRLIESRSIVTMVFAAPDEPLLLLVTSPSVLALQQRRHRMPRARFMRHSMKPSRSYGHVAGSRRSVARVEVASPGCSPVSAKIARCRRRSGGSCRSTSGYVAIGEVDVGHSASAECERVCLRWFRRQHSSMTGIGVGKPTNDAPSLQESTGP